MLGRICRVEALAAASELVSRAARDRSAIVLADSGVGLLVVGRIGEGVAALEDAAGRDPMNAAVWSDLGAGYLERFHHEGRATDLPLGLEAIERSLSLAASPEALFNRALVLEELNLLIPADLAWQQYLERDSASPWGAEGRGKHVALKERIDATAAGAETQTLRERIVDDMLFRWGRAATVDEARAALDEVRASNKQLMSRSPDRLVADLLGTIDRATGQPSRLRALMQAHASYGEARAAYTKDAWLEADRLLVTAEKQAIAAGTSLAHLVRVYRALMRYRLNDLGAAITQCEALLADPATKEYPSIRGRMHWTIGLLLALKNDGKAALSQYAEALTKLSAADERPNGAFVEMLYASQLDFVGDVEGAWQRRVSSFAFVDRESPVQSAAQAASASGWHRVAGVLYDLVADMARRSRREVVLADALRSRARALLRIGDPAGASARLEEAKALASRHPDGVWDLVRGEIDLAEALLWRTTDPRAAVAAATRAYSFFTTSRRQVRIPEVLLARARAYLAAGDAESAERDLLAGIDVLEQIRGQLDEWRLRAVLGDVVQQFGEELVPMRVAQQRTAEGFEIAERLRGWELRGRSATASAPALTTVAEAMPPRWVMAWTIVGADETFMWSITRGESRFIRVPIGRQSLAALVSRQFESDARRDLARLLVAPLLADLASAERLVFVPTVRCTSCRWQRCPAATSDSSSRSSRCKSARMLRPSSRRSIAIPGPARPRSSSVIRRSTVPRTEDYARSRNQPTKRRRLRRPIHTP